MSRTFQRTRDRYVSTIFLLQKFQMQKLLKLCILTQFYNVISIRLQGVSVEGRLFCGNRTLRNTKVRIYDADRLLGDADDLLDERFTDANGEFRLDGTTRELTTIEPKLIIYHDCDDNDMPCQKRVTIDIPTKYVHNGKVEKWYNIGDLDMKRNFPGEQRDCKANYD